MSLLSLPTCTMKLKAVVISVPIIYIKYLHVGYEKIYKIMAFLTILV